MKIITWNINSIRLRSSLICKLLKQEEPDILCLQECKSPSTEMPFEAFKPLGYSFFACWGQKSYNGVAFISKLPLENIDKKRPPATPCCFCLFVFCVCLFGARLGYNVNNAVYLNFIVWTSKKQFSSRRCMLLLKMSPSWSPLSQSY